MLKYLEGLKGTAKDKTIEMAEQRIDSGTGTDMYSFFLIKLEVHFEP